MIQSQKVDHVTWLGHWREGFGTACDPQSESGSCDMIMFPGQFHLGPYTLDLLPPLSTYPKTPYTCSNLWYVWVIIGPCIMFRYSFFMTLFGIHHWIFCAFDCSFFSATCFSVMLTWYAFRKWLSALSVTLSTPMGPATTTDDAHNMCSKSIHTHYLNRALWLR